MTKLLPAYLTLGAIAMAGCGDHHHHHEGIEAGVNDTFARAACAAFDAAPAATIAVGADPVDVPVDGRLRYFELQSVTGRVLTLTTADEHVTLAVFTDREDATLLVKAGMATMSLTPEFSNGACPDAGLIDNRLHIHTPGTHIIPLPDELSGTIGFVVSVADIGH